MEIRKNVKEAVLAIAITVLALIFAIGIFLIVEYSGRALNDNDFICRADGFYVYGNNLYDANGNEFVMRGINFPHAWFTKYDETSLDGIQKTGANCVRVVCGSGAKYTKDTVESISAVIEACKARKIISIFEAHDVTGNNAHEDLLTVVDFWIEIKESFIGQEKYCILNIANEWMSSIDNDKWKNTYIEALQRLRKAGIQNTVMIDTPAYGQHGDTVAKCGADVFRADEIRNTVFSVHLYKVAGCNAPTIRFNLNQGRKNNLCVIVGEFGYDGVDEEYIKQYCTENGIGYLGWSWKGNGHGAEYLDMSEDWEGETLTMDWGEPLVNGKYGIKQTSKICSVFE